METSIITPQLKYSSKVHDDHVSFFSNASSSSTGDMAPFAKLYVDVADNRGKFVLRKSGVTQPRVTDIWRGISERLRPDTVLDVGANYGEIALAAHYLSEARVVLFEPNPSLHPSLRRSIGSRADSAQFELVTKAVGKEDGTTLINYDRKWSGTSSIARKPKDREYKGAGEFKVETTEVSVVSIDQYLKAENIVPSTLMFKIDVEGFELSVLQGMMRTLSACAFFGIVELAHKHAGSEAEVTAIKEKLGEFGKFFSSQDGSSIDILTTDQPTGVHSDLIFTNIAGDRWRSRQGEATAG